MRLEVDPSFEGNPDTISPVDNNWERSRRLVKKMLGENRQRLAHEDLSEEDRHSLTLETKVQEAQQEILERGNKAEWDFFMQAADQGQHFKGITVGDVIYEDGVTPLQVMRIDPETRELTMQNVEAVDDEGENEPWQLGFDDLVRLSGGITRIEKIGHKFDEVAEDVYAADHYNLPPESEEVVTDEQSVDVVSKDESKKEDSEAQPSAPQGEPTVVEPHVEQAVVHKEESRVLSKHHVMFESDPERTSEYMKRARGVERLFTEPINGFNRPNLFHTLQTVMIEKPLGPTQGAVEILPNYFGDKSQERLAYVMQNFREGKSFDAMIQEAKSLSGKEQLEALSSLQVFGSRLLQWRAAGDQAHWERMPDAEKMLARLAERMVLEVELAIVEIKLKNKSAFTERQRESFFKHFERYQRNLDISDEFREHLKAGMEWLQTVETSDYKLQQPQDSAPEPTIRPFVSAGDQIKDESLRNVYKNETKEGEPVSFTTEKGSIYTYTPDGKILRYKKVENKFEEPQDAIVFIPDLGWVSENAPENFSKKFKDEDDYLDQLLRYVHEKDKYIFIVDSQGKQLKTNREIKDSESQGNNIYLTFGEFDPTSPNRFKNHFRIPVATKPKKNYSTFDIGESKNEKGQTVVTRHIGHKVVDITYRLSSAA
jgi:hypothetical protein